MRPSMWTSYLVEMLPHDMVKTFARHGWQTCELSDEHGHDLLKGGDPEHVGAEFKTFAGEHGLSFPQGHFYLCNKGIRAEDIEGRRMADIAPEHDSDFQQAQEDMRRWIDLFAALGVKARVLHLGGGALHAAGWEEKRITERRCSALALIADYAANTGVTICLENLGAGSGVQTCDQILEVIKTVRRPNVAICLDTGHANINDVSCPEFIRKAGARLKALHIADNLGRNDDHMLPYGRGTLKWTNIMTALREVGYAGLFNYEVPGENRCPMPVRLAKLDYSLTVAKWMIDHDRNT